MKRFLSFIVLMLFSYSLFAAIIVRNGLTHEFQVHNGEIVKGTIEIENAGEQSQNVKIYLQDMRYNAKGETIYTDPSSALRSNTKWIKLETNLLTLKAKEKKEIFYEISVPVKDINKGSYWSVIMVEPTSMLQPKSVTKGLTIQSVVRYAVQIITNYDSEQLKPNLQFDSVKVATTNRGRSMHIVIANTGDLYVRPTAIVEFYNKQTGEKIGRYSSISMGLLPGNDKTFDIDISLVDPGKYSAVIMAVDNADNAFAKNVVLEIKND